MPEPTLLDRWTSLPRVSGLALSPDGRRLVTTVTRLHPDGDRFTSSLLELDPTGTRDPRRLTHGATGESAPAFSADGDLLFVAQRPLPPGTPGAPASGEPPAALWSLPADGGEARLVAAPPLGVAAAVPARSAPVVALIAESFPGATSWEQDGARGAARRDVGVEALLHDGHPVRLWDHRLGPGQPRLHVVPLGGGGPRDLTPEPGRALDEASLDALPDGSGVVTTWVTRTASRSRTDLRLLPADGSAARELDHGPGNAGSPAVSPDGRWVAFVRWSVPSPDQPSRRTLGVVDLRDGGQREVAPAWDAWPEGLTWLPDSSGLLVTAYERGHEPVFRVDLDGTVTRLTASGAHADVVAAPDGRTAYAVRSHLDSPPAVVRLDVATADQQPQPVATGLEPLVPPGRVEEVVAEAADGTPLRGWLVLPADASPERPAPLVVWVHGGPLSSWAGWSWRWCPHLLAEHGYAVVMPDPAFSLGYGQAMVDRGWDGWGAKPYDDVLRVADAALARADLDPERTALMGGSFGGYLTNWVGGHTDRFRALVTHASLYALDQFLGTTDDSTYWEEAFGDRHAAPERWLADSPHASVAAWRTPTLVIHGQRDDRVPIGEALRLFADLVRHGVPARFLEFPDEGHWVLKPGNARVWYDTVLAFLDEHVLGRPFARPALV